MPSPRRLTTTTASAVSGLISLAAPANRRISSARAAHVG